MLDMKITSSIVANRVKEIINQNDLKQSIIAQKADFTEQEFTDMLNGRRLIRATDISSILYALQEIGIDANDLFTTNHN